MVTFNDQNMLLLFSFSPYRIYRIEEGRQDGGDGGARLELSYSTKAAGATDFAVSWLPPD